jgi:hypothetical protein
MTERLGELLEELAVDIADGIHSYDLEGLSQLDTLNQRQGLGLSPVHINSLKLYVLLRAYEIGSSKEHLMKPGYTHLTPKDIENACINDILKIGIIQSYGEAKKLFNKGLELYSLIDIKSLMKDL